MLVNCTEINSFWVKIISWWNHQSGDGYLVDELSILYDYNPEDKGTLIFNYFILLGKRHLFTQRFEQKTPNIDLFFDFVKGKLIENKCIFQSKGHGINKFHSLINFLFVTGASGVIYLFIYIFTVLFCSTLKYLLCLR